MVLVDFIGREAASTQDCNGPIFHKAVDWWIVVGDKDVVPSLEMGIRFAHVGETVAVWSKSKYAYGLGTRRYQPNGDGEVVGSIEGAASSSSSPYELPPESNVRYEVTVKRLASSEERTENSLEWMIATAESKKTIGNDAYANEWSSGLGKTRIKYIYEKAVKELELIVDQEEEQDEEDKENATINTDGNNNNRALLRLKAKSLLVDCLNNIAAVHLRAKEYHAAKEAAVKVLQRDANNFKGLIRAAKAALLDPASSYEEVNAAIQAAAEKAIGVQEMDLAKLRADFQRRKQAYEQKSKSMYAKALGGTGSATKKSVAGSSSNEEETSAGNLSSDHEGQNEPQQQREVKPKPFTWSDLTTWPWSSILAYAFQLALPFVMWSMAQRFRADLPQPAADGEREAAAFPSPDVEFPSLSSSANDDSQGFNNNDEF